MKCLFVIICLILEAAVYAQTQPPTGMEQQLENITEQNEDAETTDDSWMQQMEYLKKNPVNLNTATVNDLQDFQILNPLQIENFVSYRKLLGKLISIYELQAVPEWDIPTIQKLLPYITVTDAVTITGDFKNRLKNGDHSMLMRYSRTLEQSDGYSTKDSGQSYYAGDPSRMIIRYKYQYKNLLQYGITAGKDAGESFFSGSSKYGFDFYSFHFFARNIGIIKSVALGDYTVNMGQGLIYWQGLAFGKGGDAVNIKRQSATLKPYNSSGSYYFNRGAALTVGVKRWQATGFLSFRKLDANLTSTDTLAEDIVSSIHVSGYHRTQSEMEDKAALRLISYGGNVKYVNNKWQLGINAVQYQFNTLIHKKEVPYNLYVFSGKNWLNYSADYSFTYRNLHFFGETAFDKNNNMATINGLLVSVDRSVDMMFLYRNISEKYQSLYGNAFTINTLPTNEKGLYAGISIRPVYKIKLDAYTDLFSFAWLKYRVDAPSRGQEYFLQCTYTPSKQAEVVTRFRSINKPLNNTAAGNALNEVINFANKTWRTQINYQLNNTWSIRQRFELLWYTRENENPEKGFLSFFDIFFKPKMSKLSLNTRLQYFESDSYNSRLYAYENDVLYYYAVPVFYDKGVRYYLNIKYNILKSASVWIKWGQSIYSNKTSIGSGLDEIAGNKKSEIRILLSVNF
ncbi:MAG: helix-hairpin-helix domain-containing protein [Chitinophagaceae bacterium]|nr:helix-hairpin-helix domain-containing protein [Chitinophagaceae bacterium]